MKKQNLLLLIVAFLQTTFLLTSCQDNKKEELSILMNKFVTSNKGFNTIDTSLVSSDLKQLIADANQVTEESALKIKNSSYPTDKPLVIEGDIFTSLYEGATNATILNVNLDTLPVTAQVEFFNKYYNEKWVDEVQFVNENGWKIDNVILLKESEGRSTKQILQNFIQLGMHEDLIGKWFQPHGAQVNIQFQSNGTFLYNTINDVTLKDQVLEGTYKLNKKDSTLTLSYQNTKRPNEVFQFYKGEKGDENFYIKRQTETKLDYFVKE